MDYERVYAKIDLDAIEHNIRLVRGKIPDKTRLALVIKADAYGHGAVVLAQEFESLADYFAVAEMDEAVELRRSGIRRPILILGYTSPSLYEKALDYDITLTVFQPDRIRTLSALAEARGKRARVHFAVDTGMSRIGWEVSEKSADEAADAAKLPGIEAEGIFSHFAAADEADKTLSMTQRAEFDRFLAMLKARGISLPIVHLDNSAGLLEFDRYDDMVRAGIVIYGLYPSETVRAELGDRFPLEPAIELISHISHIKTLAPNHGVSYGATYVTDHTVRVATVPVGYADGYPRALSGKGEVLVRGRRCPVLGRICMDQMMVDISAVPEAEIEDRVVLAGCDGGEQISIYEVADMAYSFPYEWVCGISRRVPRVYFRGGKPYRTVSYIREGDI